MHYLCYYRFCVRISKAATLLHAYYTPEPFPEKQTTNFKFRHTKIKSFFSQIYSELLEAHQLSLSAWQFVLPQQQRRWQKQAEKGELKGYEKIAYI